MDRQRIFFCVLTSPSRTRQSRKRRLRVSNSTSLPLVVGKWRARKSFYFLILGRCDVMHYKDCQQFDSITLPMVVLVKTPAQLQLRRSLAVSGNVEKRCVIYCWLIGRMCHTCECFPKFYWQFLPCFGYMSSKVAWELRMKKTLILRTI